MSDARPRSMKERDMEVLRELEAACRSRIRFVGSEWVRPLDCGGVNGSDHSYRLSKLARAGLAESERSGGWSRGSKQYRITDKGRDAIRALVGEAAAS